MRCSGLEAPAGAAVAALEPPAEPCDFGSHGPAASRQPEHVALTGGGSGDASMAPLVAQSVQTGERPKADPAATEGAPPPSSVSGEGATVAPTVTVVRCAVTVVHCA